MLKKLPQKYRISQKYVLLNIFSGIDKACLEYVFEYLKKNNYQNLNIYKKIDLGLSRPKICTKMKSMQ